MSDVDFDDDSFDDENISYLITCRMMPGMQVDDKLIGERHWSIAGKKGNELRGVEEAHSRVYGNYLHEHWRYDERDFERRFHMPQVVLEQVFEAIEGKVTFVQRAGCTR